MSATRISNAIKATWLFFSRPSTRWPLGIILLAGVAAGALALGGYNEVVVQTNKISFCRTCHEMNDFVYPDYAQSVHFKNPMGVRAHCKDCHEPGTWGPQFIAKVKSFRELYHHFARSVWTRKEFEKARPELDRRVWANMKGDDSRTCRKCHSWDAMVTAAQPPAARASHLMGSKNGLTCIDCHRGIMRLKANFVPPAGAASPSGGGTVGH